MQDAPTKPSEEESVLGMERRSRNAATKDATTMPTMEVVYKFGRLKGHTRDKTIFLLVMFVHTMMYTGSYEESAE